MRSRRADVVLMTRRETNENGLTCSRYFPRHPGHTHPSDELYQYVGMVLFRNQRSLIDAFTDQATNGVGRTSTLARELASKTVEGKVTRA